MALLLNILRGITVEPVLFAYMLGTFLKMPVTQQVYFKKNCIHMYNDSFCQNIFKNRSCEHSTKEYDAVEGETSEWILYNSVAYGAPSVVFALLFGSLSDQFGRKLIMVLPIIGICIESVSAIVNIHYIDAAPKYLLIGSTLSGFCGGFSTLLMVVFAYVADITKGVNRTWRICLLESMTFLGGTIGELISGVLIDNLGFTAPYILVLSLNVVAIIYVLVFLHESYVPQQKCSIGNLFSCRNCLGGIEVLTKVRSNHNKLYLLLLTCIGFTVPVIVFSGANDVVVLFMLNYPFCFSSTMIGYFLAVQLAIITVGVILGIPFMNRVLKLSDPVIAIVGILSTIASKTFLAFTRNSWQAFLAISVAILHGTTIPCVRAMTSKLVGTHEQGSLFAVLASVETVSSIVASLIFNNIYKSTVSTFPGLSFLVMAGILVLPLCCMILFYIRPRTVNNTLQDEADLIDSQESSA